MISLFLFGAGASFGSGPCFPSNPPLGAKFFSALRSQGGVATTVSNDLANLFSEDFEAGMDRFWQEHNTDTSELLRDMARFFAPFEPLDDNCYIQLIKILSRTRSKSIFATTNYDVLIEIAIAKTGLLYCYAGLSALEQNLPVIPVLKIHGSCNFLPNLGDNQISNIRFDLSAPSNPVFLESPIRIATSAQEIMRFCNADNSLAPAMAMYNTTKRVIHCPKFVQNQLDEFHITVKQVDRIYIIGLRVHVADTHIWDSLAASEASLYYIGREPEDFQAWARSNCRNHAQVLANSFEEGLQSIARHHGN